MPRFLGESYPVGVGSKALTAAARRARLVAAEMRAEGIGIRFVKSTFVPAEDALMCLFDAPSADVVRELGRRAGLPVERVVEAVELASHSDAKRNGP
jgi:uncharacterized protein DUF4242